MPLNPYLRVALLGFSDFEQRTLGSVLRLAGPRSGGYAQVAEIADADAVVANADSAAVIDAVSSARREADTIFVGQRRPALAGTFLRRPIDASQVLRELDALRARRAERADRAADARAAAVAPVPPVAPTTVLAPAAPAIDEPPPLVAAAPTTALVVDDSAVASRFLQLRLQQLGLSVDVVDSSQAALQALTVKDYAWVFLDVELGDGSEIDGLALCQQIRSDTAKSASRLVMVSAHDSPLDRVRGTFAGCDHYLAKPVDADGLRALVSPPPAGARPRRRRRPEAGAEAANSGR